MVVLVNSLLSIFTLLSDVLYKTPGRKYYGVGVDIFISMYYLEAKMTLSSSLTIVFFLFIISILYSHFYN